MGDSMNDVSQDTQRKDILDLVTLLRRASDGALEATYNDPQLVASYALAEKKARARTPGSAFHCERLDPESIFSLKAAHRDLVTALFHLPYERFDDLVGGPDDLFAVLARRAPGGMALDIEPVAAGAQAKPGWIVVAPVAAPGQLDSFSADMEKTLNSSNFARLHLEAAAKRAGNALANQSDRRVVEETGQSAAVDATIPAVASRSAAPATTAEEARDSARFTLARMWALNHEEDFLPQAFKAVHGMSAEAAFKVAAEAVGAAAAPEPSAAKAPRKSPGLTR
jgi:hypothetical protein